LLGDPLGTLPLCKVESQRREDLEALNLLLGQSAAYAAAADAQQVVDIERTLPPAVVIRDDDRSPVLAE
jgi:hypothetical protein